MNSITLNNYEAYLLDFSEGNLSEKDQIELEIFLFNNPQLKIDLNDLAFCTLEYDSQISINKQLLKKSLNDLVSENQFVDYIENQLSEKEKLVFEKNCQLNENVARELELYKHTILKPDFLIVFPQKNKLKRQSKLLLFGVSSEIYAAAASVLLLIGLFVFWQKSSVLDFNGEKNSNALSLLSKKNTAISAKKSPLQQKNQSTSLSNLMSGSIFKVKTTHRKVKSEISEVPPPIKNEIVQIVKPDSFLIQENVAKSMISEKEREQKNNLIKIVDINTEYENGVSSNEIKENKEGIWSKFGNVLRKLHQVGLQPVDGNQEIEGDVTQYSLTLGSLTIKHKTAANTL